MKFRILQGLHCLLKYPFWDLRSTKGQPRVPDPNGKVCLTCLPGKPSPLKPGLGVVNSIPSLSLGYSSTLKFLPYFLWPAVSSARLEAVRSGAICLPKPIQF